MRFQTPSSAIAANAPGWLKTVRSGKIKKTARKQQSLSHLTTAQILDAADSTCKKSTLPVGKGNKKPIDAQSLTESTRKQMKAQVRSKKARQLLKKEVFRKKVEDIKAEEKSKRERKARQKTVIVGDLRPIFDALPSVPSLDDEIQALVNKCQSTETRTKRKLTMKRRQAEIAQGLNYFSSNLKK